MRMFAILAAAACLFAQDANLLSRRYEDGEKLTYRMKGVNEAWRYEIQATGRVTRNAGGRYVEEFAWSDLISDGSAFALPPGSVAFRQILSLDPQAPPAIPNLGAVHPKLIGPITDLLTFYADLWLAARTGKLSRAGDHVYQKHGTPASWADGRYVVLGEDSIDFDITLLKIDQVARVATLLVAHVPPAQPSVRLPADWMKEPVAGSPNNWVNVAKLDGKYVAAVGKETFDVRMSVSLVDGKILSGTLENPVTTRERDCQDADLLICGAPRAHPIMRRIEIELVR